MSPNASVVRDVRGAEGEVNDTISWKHLMLNSTNFQQLIWYTLTLYALTGRIRPVLPKFQF